MYHGTYLHRGRSYYEKIWNENIHQLNIIIKLITLEWTTFVVNRRGSLDQTRSSASRLMWWCVPVNLTWSSISDQVTVIIIYLYRSMLITCMSFLHWLISVPQLQNKRCPRTEIRYASKTFKGWLGCVWYGLA